MVGIMISILNKCSRKRKSIQKELFEEMLHKYLYKCRILSVTLKLQKIILDKIDEIPMSITKKTNINLFT